MDGKLLASTDTADYNLIAPIMGYGWGDDEDCFEPDAAPHKIVVGSLRYTPVIGAYHVRNVTITGSGTIDGQGAIWHVINTTKQQQKVILSITNPIHSHS